MLKKAFDLWQPPVKNDEEALLFMTRIISRKVEQYFTSLYKENDPIFAKILASLNNQIRVNGYHKEIYGGLRYISAGNKSITESVLSAPYIDEEELYNIPASYFSQKHCLEHLFDYLQSNGNRPSLPLNALVHRIKELSFGGFSCGNGENADSVIEFNERIRNILQNVNHKIDDYVIKEKLNKDEGIAIKLTIENLCTDYTDGGLNAPVFDYLKVHLPGLTDELYRAKYQNIFEYIIKIFKQSVAEEFISQSPKKNSEPGKSKSIIS